MEVVVNGGHLLPGLLVAPTCQNVITKKIPPKLKRKQSERKKEQTQRRRKSVAKGRGFDGGKKK